MFFEDTWVPGFFHRTCAPISCRNISPDPKHAGFHTEDLQIGNAQFQTPTNHLCDRVDQLPLFPYNSSTLAVSERWQKDKKKNKKKQIKKTLQKTKNKKKKTKKKTRIWLRIWRQSRKKKNIPWIIVFFCFFCFFFGFCFFEVFFWFVFFCFFL